MNRSAAASGGTDGRAKRILHFAYTARLWERNDLRDGRCASDGDKLYAFVIQFLRAVV